MVSGKYAVAAPKDKEPAIFTRSTVIEESALMRAETAE
jgi:hypothetical protein